MDEKGNSFAKAVGSGDIEEAKRIALRGGGKILGVSTSYEPTVEALAAGAAEAAKRADPDALAYALGFGFHDKGGALAHAGPICPQAFLNSERSGGDYPVWIVRGPSLWMRLFESGRAPGDPGFDRCARAIAKASKPWGMDAKMCPGGGGDRTLLAELAARGWIGVAEEVERECQGRFEPGEAALRSALEGAQPEAAAWLLRRGAPRGPQAFEWAARAIEGAKLGAGEPSWERRLAALRIGAKVAGAAAIADWSWGFGQEAPSDGAGRMAAWALAKAAKAADRGRPFAQRVASRAAALAGEEGLAWGELVAAGKAAGAEPKGWFSKMSHALAKEKSKAALAAKGRLEAQAARELAERDASEADLGPMLARLERGDFEGARACAANWLPAQAVGACAALMALAKMGYWDMAEPRGEAGEGAERHALRWAGFKVAIAAAKGHLNRPVDGLGGAGLAALAAGLGFADACEELASAGASLDPDPLIDGPSPLLLAVRGGHFALAQALLAAGASPCEGAKPGMIGFQPKAWAIHEAVSRGAFGIAEAMLGKDPQCAQLPDAGGEKLAAKLAALAGSPSERDREAAGRLAKAAGLGAARDAAQAGGPQAQAPRRR